MRASHRQRQYSKDRVEVSYTNVQWIEGIRKTSSFFFRFLIEVAHCDTSIGINILVAHEINGDDDDDNQD